MMVIVLIVIFVVVIVVIGGLVEMGELINEVVFDYFLLFFGIVFMGGIIFVIVFLFVWGFGYFG